MQDWEAAALAWIRMDERALLKSYIRGPGTSRPLAGGRPAKHLVAVGAMSVVRWRHYGVPQKRERVIIVGFRSDLGVEWSFPNTTHSLDALLRDQWVSSGYWERHKVPKRKRPSSDRYKERIERLRTEQTLFEPEEKPWRTVRDALADLPDPEQGNCSAFYNHEYTPGARSYTGHTGSPLDEPAKTLKAGDHGVPGGENTLLKPDGSLRYFTVRESARLQTFPDHYVFPGVWTEAMRQLGNAVPVALGEAVAKGIRQKLSALP